MLAPARPGAGRRLQDPRQRRVGWFWKPERSGHAAEGLVGTPHQILVGDVQRAGEPGLAEAHPQGRRRIPLAQAAVQVRLQVEVVAGAHGDRAGVAVDVCGVAPRHRAPAAGRAGLDVVSVARRVQRARRRDPYQGVRVVHAPRPAEARHRVFIRSHEDHRTIGSLEAHLEVAAPVPRRPQLTLSAAQLGAEAFEERLEPRRPILWFALHVDSVLLRGPRRAEHGGPNAEPHLMYGARLLVRQGQPRDGPH